MRDIEVGDLVVSQQLVMPMVRTDMVKNPYGNSIMLVVSENKSSQTVDVFSQGSVFYGIEKSGLLIVYTDRIFGGEYE